MDSVSPLWIARPNTAIATQDSSANSAEAPNSTRWEDNVAEAAEDCQRADCNQYPLNYAQEALTGCIDVACGSVEVRHELTVGACSQVPGQVHSNQEDDGLHVHGVLQSGCHHLAEGLLLGGGSVLFGPVGGFLQLTLKVPGDKGNDEQNQEQQAGCQHAVKRAVGACGEQGGAIRLEARDDEALMTSERMKMMAGPQLHANWLMPMLEARFVEVDVSEI